MTSTVSGQQVDLYSGIAVPGFAVDDDVVREEIIVRLPGPIGEGFQATAAVNLASVANTGSDFLFATDAAWVELDPPTGDLLLHVQLAVGGDESWLHRFGYHVNVLSAPVEPTIVGSIEWDRSWGDPADPLPTFEIDVYGQGGFGWVARGFSDPAIRGVDIGGNPIWAASFTVRGSLPLDTDLTVMPALIGGFTPPAHNGRDPVFTPAQRAVRFSYDQLIAFAGFELSFQPPPR